MIGRSTHDRGQVRGRVDRGGRLLLRRPVLADARPSRAAPRPGLDLVRAAAELAPDKPWFAIGGIDETTARGARRGRAPNRGGARDHRRRRSAGRGASGSALRLVISIGIDAATRAELGPSWRRNPDAAAARRPRPRATQRSSALSRLGTVWQQFGGVGDDGGVGPVGSAGPRHLAVTTDVRTVIDSASSPASSLASRTAASSTVSWLSRAPPGRPHVPP